MNGLRAQGSAAGTASWGSVPTSRRADYSLYKLLLSECFFFPLSLRKANFLGKKPKTLACGSMFHILLCMWIFGVYVESFKKEVFVRMWYSAARVKCGWLLNHFTGGEGHMFYPSLEVCSAFLSVYFVLFSEDFFFLSFP